MPDSTSFKNRLNMLIADADCSRADFAKQAQVSATTISHATLYGIIPKLANLVKLADALEVSVPYLLGKTETNDFIKSENPTTFRERFNELCRETGLTRYKVSQKCFFDKSDISRWMSKGYLPSLEILELMADLFRVSVDYLLGRTDYRN